MSLPKWIIGITLWMTTLQASSANLNLSDAKTLALNFVSSNSQSTTRKTVTEQKSFFKETFLVRVQTPSITDVPAKLIAVNKKKEIRELPLSKDLKDFLLALNYFIPAEKFQLQNAGEAKDFLKKLVNIYGIYDLTASCQMHEREKQYLCTIEHAAPRDFKGKIFLDKEGLVLWRTQN